MSGAPYLQDADCTLYHGDALETLAGMADASVDCVVTSPPYWGLRDYGTGGWEGGDDGCDHAKREGQRQDVGRVNTDGFHGSAKDSDLATRYYADVCADCGARRVDQQLGLEPTPDTYVTALVQIFREVRRVLAPHGTCWVNLGDSYAHNNTQRRTPDEQQREQERDAEKGYTQAWQTGTRAGWRDRAATGVPAGLKEKDMVGIPWRVARALQEPYYTGEIKDERDRIWLAAMVEAEGCLYIHKRKAGQPNGQGYERKNDSYSSGMEVASTDRVIVERCLAIAGKGSICEQTPEQAASRKQTIYRWTLRSNECRAVVTELYPHFVAKHHEARILIGCPSSGADAEKAHASLKALHQGEPPTIDFPAPSTLYEPGWYLRSDVVWSKPNPMPESVTDRPTKAHEYVFLLTKQPRYYFDQEAVREKYEGEFDPRDFTEGNFRRGSYVHDKHHPTRGARGPDGRHVTRVLGQDGSEQHRDGERWPNPAGRNVRSVWTIATQPYPEAHFACVDDQTEALTPSGWKRHSDLADGDPIAVYDPQTDACRFEAATFHRYDYDGELVAITKRDSSQRLTPNHRCLVRRRSGSTEVVEAAALKPGMDVMTFAPLSGWHRDHALTRDVDTAFAALTGWFVAEGHITSIKRVEIYQSQSANPHHVQTIRSLLEYVGGDWSERTRHRSTSTEVEFVIRGALATELTMLAPDKRLNGWTLSLPEQARAALLDALIDGDGHRRADGRACIVQKDKAQIDMMQVLALSLGYRAVVSQRKDGQYVLYLTRGRWLTLRGTNGKHTPIGREHYAGTVWCPNVETGFWLARRDGRPFVTGNTYPEELVRRCVLAGCPERVCRTCGKASERELERKFYGNLRTEDNKDGHRDAEVGITRNEFGGQKKWGEYEAPQTLGWSDCGHHDYRPGVVLDPFVGSGTTLFVARNHGRHSVGIELNEKYLELAARRLAQQSLLALSPTSEPA